MSEDDAHLQTLYRMSETETVVLTPPPAGTKEEQQRRIVEYCSDFIALSVLNNAIGQPNRRRLVQVDLPGHDENGRGPSKDRYPVVQLDPTPSNNFGMAVLGMPTCGAMVGGFWLTSYLYQYLQRLKITTTRHIPWTCGGGMSSYHHSNGH